MKIPGIHGNWTISTAQNLDIYNEETMMAMVVIWRSFNANVYCRMGTAKSILKSENDVWT